MVAVAGGYGVPSRSASGREEIAHALSEAVAAVDGPRLVRVAVASGCGTRSADLTANSRRRRCRGGIAHESLGTMVG